MSECSGDRLQQSISVYRVYIIVRQNFKRLCLYDVACWLSCERPLAFWLLVTVLWYNFGLLSYRDVSVPLTMILERLGNKRRFDVHV